MPNSLRKKINFSQIKQIEIDFGVCIRIHNSDDYIIY